MSLHVYLNAALLFIVAAAMPARADDWQNPNVKILGDVSYGPPLQPVNSTGGPVEFEPWGPRKFSASGRLLNTSSRAYVVGSDRPLISGVVVSTGSRILLIRAVGPTLGRFNVPMPLPRPALELFDGSGKRVASAVPWSTTSADTRIELREAAKSCGAFPLDEGSADAVLLVHLGPGVYSCVVSGIAGSEGNVLCETYAVLTNSLGQ